MAGRVRLEFTHRLSQYSTDIVIIKLELRSRLLSDEIWVAIRAAGQTKVGQTRGKVIRKFQSFEHKPETRKFKMMLNLKQNTSSIILVTAIATTLLICIMMQNAHGAPAASNNNSRGNNNNSNNNNKNGNNNGRLIRTGILSNLFRRQIGSSSPGSTTEASTESSEVDEPQSQTERDAHKFLDSLPNPVSTESLPDEPGRLSALERKTNPTKTPPGLK